METKPSTRTVQQRGIQLHSAAARGRGRTCGLLVALLAACAMLFAFPVLALADNGELAASGGRLGASDASGNVVTIDYGSKHASYVQKIFEPASSNPIDVEDYGEGKNYTVSLGVNGSEVSYSIEPSPVNVGKAKEIITMLSFQLIRGETGRIDGGVLLLTDCGKHPLSEYKSEREYDEERLEDFSWLIPSEGVKLHAFWAQPVGDFEVTIQPLTCGTTVTKKPTGGSGMYYTDPRVQASVTGNAAFDSSFSTNWETSDFKNLFEGLVVGEQNCYAHVYLTAKFGYYFSGEEKVTVTKGELCDYDAKTGDISAKYASINAKLVVTHDWGDASYTWSSDDKTVTASHTCKAEGCEKTESETVDVSSQVIKPSTCVAKGETLLTATFEVEGFEPQTKVIAAAIDPDAHDWGSPTYKWSADKGKVTATRTCKLAAAHVQSETVATTSKMAKAATASASGTRVYTAKFKASWAQTQTKKETIARLAPDPAPVTLAKAVAKGKTKLKMSWNKVTGAGRYLVYFAPCKKKGKTSKLKKVKTLGAKTTTFTKGGLKANTAYRAKVVAQAKQNGKWVTVSKSKVVHAVTANRQGKYTNAKDLALYSTSKTLKKGKSFKLGGIVQKAKEGEGMTAAVHVKLLRFTTGNKYVATVNANGKVTAKLPGTCKIYAQTANGLWRTCKVVVK